MEDGIVKRTHLACPNCSFREELEIPADYCLFFHTCANCETRLRSASGDCCVFCSYEDTLCIPKQQEHLEAKDNER